MDGWMERRNELGHKSINAIDGNELKTALDKRQGAFSNHNNNNNIPPPFCPYHQAESASFP